MNYSYSEFYFAIVSLSTVVIVTLILFIFSYILSILSDIKKLSSIAKKEAEIISSNFEKGIGFLGKELSDEAAGFIKMIFAMLLGHFAPKKRSKSKKV